MEINSSDDTAVDATNDGGNTSLIIERLRTKMEERAKVRLTPQSPTIYRVPDVLRKLDPDAYEPQVISLGPYHHGKAHLKSMDEIKCEFLDHFLSRKPSVGLDEYVCQVETLESRIRDAYSEAPQIEATEFIEMMLLDACFVLGFLYGDVPTASYKGWDIRLASLDMLRLENQIPFFLLEELHQLSCSSETRPLTLNIYHKFFDLMPGKIRYPSTELGRYHHILHLLVSCAQPKTELELQMEELERQRITPNTQGRMQFLFQNSQRRLKIFYQSTQRTMNFCFPLVSQRSTQSRKPKLQWIPCARRLHESGVVFRRKELDKCESFLDITFEQGTMEIPPLQIVRDIKPVLRNLIAFEQCRGPANEKKAHVTAYACLMDFIIDTPKDVEMLDGIIFSTLGNDKEIARLFSSLSVHLSVVRSSYLSGVYQGINVHCERGWNKCMATLRHNYFSNPWAWISVMGAIVLFLLTTMQTTLAFLSYLHSI